MNTQSAADNSMLQLDPREQTNKLGIAKIREQGLIPGVIYGGGTEDLFSVSYQAMEKIMRKGCFFNTLLDVNLNGKKCKVLPKAAQSHVVSDRIMHLEFHRVTADHIVIVSIPVKAINEQKSDVIKRGGKIHYALPLVKVRCAASAIPAAVLLDVSELKVGKTIKIGDLKLPGKIEVLHDNHLTIVKMTGKKVKEEAKTEE